MEPFITAIIERLKSHIKYSEDNNEDLSAVSWNYQEGILISVNDAKRIVANLEQQNPSISISEDVKGYSEKEVIEIVRHVIYGNTPEYYEQGGVNGVINFPKGETYRKATEKTKAALELLNK